MRALLMIACILTPILGYAEEPRTVQQNWNKYCKKCHGTDGDATKIGLRMGSPENIYDAAEHSDFENIFNVILEGEKKMPSFKKKLSEAEIKELAAHIEYSCLIKKVMSKRDKIEKELKSIREEYGNLPECKQ